MELENMQPAVSVRGLSKHFGGVYALRGVDIDIMPGEIHGLLGHNGSGKSTLIKMLAGYHTPDAGEICVLGDILQHQSDRQNSVGSSLRFVHQDLGLIPTLSVLDNLLVLEMVQRRNRIRWSVERAKAARLLAEFGVEVSPYALVSSLSPLDRARVAIVRAFAKADEDRPCLVVLDEPTVFLPKSEATELFKLVRSVAHQGTSILFVSHHLEEIKELTDRVTVLREGEVVDTVATGAVSEDELVHLIVGRHVAHTEAASPVAADAATSLEVRNLTGRWCRGVGWSSVTGSIVGLAGVVGSGAEEVAELLFGVGAGSGTIVLHGEELDVATLNPVRAAKAGIASVPADRIGHGSYAELSLRDNVMSQRLAHYFRGGALRLRTMSNEARQSLTRFGVRPPEPDLTFSALSGGNQQKVMLARWLQITPRLLLLNEPTQGVDVAAREDILRLVRRAADDGATVLVASSDFDQLADLCNTVLVFSRGQIRQVLKGDDVTKDNILHSAARSSSVTTAEQHQEVPSS